MKLNTKLLLHKLFLREKGLYVFYFGVSDYFHEYFYCYLRRLLRASLRKSYDLLFLRISMLPSQFERKLNYNKRTWKIMLEIKEDLLYYLI